MALAVIHARFLLAVQRRRAKLEAFRKLLHANDHPLLGVEHAIDFISANFIAHDDETVKQAEHRFERHLDTIFSALPTFVEAILNPPRVDLKRVDANAASPQALLLSVDATKFFLENPLALQAVKRRARLQ